MKNIGFNVPMFSALDVTVGNIKFKAGVTVNVPYLNDDMKAAVKSKVLSISLPDFEDIDPDDPQYDEKVEAVLNDLTGDGALEAMRSSPTSPTLPTELVPPPEKEEEPKRGSLPPAVVKEDSIDSDGNFLAGTGIPSHFVATGGSDDLEFQLGVYTLPREPKDIPRPVWRAGIPHYNIKLADSDGKVRIFFGVAATDAEILSDSNIVLKIADPESFVLFDLIPVSGSQGYNWGAQDADYLIDDSVTNSDKNISQNVTRLDFLRDAELLSAESLTGNYTLEFQYSVGEESKTFKVTFTVS